MVTPLQMDEVLRRIHKLPSLPAVVMELLASRGQDDINTEALAQKIARDQALTVKTLRLANSSFYGMENQVTTVQAAIAILGFRTVRSLVTTAALIGTFANDGQTRVNLTPFWRHAIAVAVCARELATGLKLDADCAYIAGLLHDIGRLVLVTQFPSDYAAVMDYRKVHDCLVLAAETSVLGVDHATVGYALVQRWKFPQTIQDVVADHHAPSVVQARPLSLVIRAADAITHALDLSQDEDAAVPPVPTSFWKQLGLSDKELLQVFARTVQQFEGASLVLNL
jgi:putative nucleotidyltransferase with HDIG domain